jgi:hypothetical protein
MKKYIFPFFLLLSFSLFGSNDSIGIPGYRPIKIDFFEKIPWVLDVRVLTDVTLNTTQDYLSVYDSSALVWKKIKVNTFFSTGGSGTYWALGSQAITAESSIGSTDAFGVNFKTNNTNRLRLSSAGRFFSGTLTDVVLTATDSVKIVGLSMDLAPTNELKVTSSAQTSLRSIGGLHSYISATSPNASGNAGHLWENSADANNGYNMRREADGVFYFARASDYPYSTEIDTIFTYNPSTGVFDFDVTNLTFNGTTVAGDFLVNGGNAGAVTMGSTDDDIDIIANGNVHITIAETGGGQVDFSGDDLTDIDNITAQDIFLDGGMLQSDLGTTTASANDITLPMDGNLVKITGNTIINTISTTGWVAGGKCSLIFTNISPAGIANAAGGAGASVLCPGAVTFVPLGNQMIEIGYDGTNFFIHP